MKHASGEFRRKFFGFSKIWYMVWSCDSQLITNVDGHEVEGQDQDIKARSKANNIMMYQ